MLGLNPRLPLGIEDTSLLVAGGRAIIDLVRESDLKAIKTILPEDRFVPKGWSGTMGDVEDLALKVAERMGIADLIETVMHPDGSPTRLLDEAEAEPAASGQAVRVVSVDGRLVRAPEALVAALARALAPLRLGGAAQKGEAMEQLVELLPLFFGFGLYCANTVLLRRSYGYGDGVARFSVWPLGEMPGDTIGSAMALISEWRGEDSTVFQDYLDATAASAFKKTLRFLRKNRLGVWGASAKGEAHQDLGAWLLARPAPAAERGRAAEEPSPGQPPGEEKASLERIDVLGCGTFLGEIEVSAGEDGSLRHRLVGADLDMVTSTIPLEEGICFGFMFRAVASRVGEAFDLRAVYRHPELAGPDGAGRTTSEARIRARDHDETAAFWSFDGPGKMAAGRWVIELWHDGSMMASREFEVVAEGKKAKG